MPYFLVKQMLFRERLKHQVQEEKCNLCNKKVHWGDGGGGGIMPRHNQDSFVVTVSVMYSFFLKKCVQ